MLLAMLNNSSAIEVFRACGAHIELLKREINQFLEETTR